MAPLPSLKERYLHEIKFLCSQSTCCNLEFLQVSFAFALRYMVSGRKHHFQIPTLSSVVFSLDSAFVQAQKEWT